MLCRRVALAAALLLVALLLMPGNVSAAQVRKCWHSGDHEGVYQASWGAGSFNALYYHGSCHDLYVKYYFDISDNGKWTFHRSLGDCTCTHGISYTVSSGYGHGEGIYHLTGSNRGCYGRNFDSADSLTVTFIISAASFTEYIVSGTTDCVSSTQLWIDMSGTYTLIDSTASSSYSFGILDGYSYRLLFDGVYYDFTCTDSDVAFDYDACMWVYGYTCGIDSIKLYVDTGGSWALDDTESQSGWYENYEIPIVGGEDYLISFLDRGAVCHNQTFTCTGDHVHIDYDRCEWIYPPYPPAPPIPIYIWTGYGYNIVVFRDEHGNFIENSQLAIYDKTDNQYLQRWMDTADGYTLLGARFNTDHDVLLSLRTFDGIFTLDTTYPANGSAPVGEENITTTNWTIPIKYNLNVLPVDQYGASLFNVFAGLSEYTPLNPGAFWGMDLSDQGYVPVTNCSGFAMCDIIAGKEGYADYKVEALNWTSKSALVKDYRHNIVMEEE